MTRAMQYVVETLWQPGSPPAKIVQDVVEVLCQYPTPAFTSITGAGISQDIVEVLYSRSDPYARVSSDVIEVLCQTIDTVASGGDTPVTSGWVSII